MSGASANCGSRRGPESRCPPTERPERTFGVPNIGIAGGSCRSASSHPVAFAGSNWGTIPELVEVIALADGGRL